MEIKAFYIWEILVEYWLLKLGKYNNEQQMTLFLRLDGVFHRPTDNNTNCKRNLKPNVLFNNKTDFLKRLLLF